MQWLRNVFLNPRSPTMPEPTKLQSACERLEQTLHSMTQLLQDIKVYGAEVNAQALLHDQPTINFQAVAPNLAEGIEGLWDQLSNIEAWGEGETGTNVSTLERVDVLDPKLLEAAVRGIEAMTHISHEIAHQRGWWNNPETGEPYPDDQFERKVLLMHTELSEATEAYRTDAMDKHLQTLPGVSVEFADLLHRVFDLAGRMGLDLGQAYIEKGKFNLTRPDHSREARQGPGGKRF